MSKSIMTQRLENKRLSEVIRNHEKLNEAINLEIPNLGVAGSNPAGVARKSITYITIGVWRHFSVNTVLNIARA
jgi:hypothetical protein